MSQEDLYRLARHSPRDRFRSGDEEDSRRSPTVRKTRQQRHSVISAERSPHLDFTQTPFGNDDMFNGCFADCDGEEVNYENQTKHEPKLSRTEAITSHEWNDRKRSWQMPTMGGKDIRCSDAVETGLYDSFETDFKSMIRRRHSEYFRDPDRLTRSFQDELFSRYPRSYGPWQTEPEKHIKWTREVDGFTHFSDIYGRRWVAFVSLWFAVSVLHVMMVLANSKMPCKSRFSSITVNVGKVRQPEGNNIA